MEGTRLTGRPTLCPLRSLSTGHRATGWTTLLEGGAGTVFMQLWEGRSPAGSAACPAPALTRQSPPARTRLDTHANRHRHAHTPRCTHACICTDQRHTHVQVYTWATHAPTDTLTDADTQAHSEAHAHTNTQGHTEIHVPPSRGGAGGKRSEENAQPRSRVARSRSLHPSTLTPVPTASDLSPGLTARPGSAQPHTTGTRPQRGKVTVAGTETHAKWSRAPTSGANPAQPELIRHNSPLCTPTSNPPARPPPPPAQNDWWVQAAECLGGMCGTLPPAAKPS